jgi:mannosyltransferase OCH1-like enzyme
MTDRDDQKIVLDFQCSRVPLTERSSSRMNSFRRLLVLFLFTLSLYFICFIRNQLRFEQFLDSLFISFNDFPPTYARALNDSVSRSTQVEFNYSVFSENNSSSSYSSKIPRIIHFIWFKNLYETHSEISDIPASGSNTPDLCRKYNPDFTINIWNTTAAHDFFEAEYAWFLPTYDAYIHPIQRVDALKYFLLWHYGGVYMDLDISCRRALDPLLAFPAWFPRASPLGVNNDLMATVARHPIMGKMTESLQSRNKRLLFPYLTVFWSTGPRFTSDMLMAWFREHILGGSVVRASSKQNAGK